MEELVKEVGNSGKRIDAFSILRAVIKQWWMILVVASIAAMCSVIVVTEQYSPTYTTEATFFVSTKNSSTVYSGLTTATSLADVFTVVLNSQILKEKVSQEAGISYSDVTISANVVPETNLLVLKVRSSNPRKSYQAMDSVIKNHGIVTQEIMGNAILDIISAPSVPRRPDMYLNTQTSMRNTFIIAAAVMIAIIALFSFLRDDIKNEQDVNRKLDTKLLVTVYHENKYKTLKSRLHKIKRSILVTDPATSFAFVETYRKLRTKIEYRAKKDNIKTILVTSVLENEGKSTVAANLALILAQKYRVLLIDADLRKPAMYKIFEQDKKDKTGLLELLKEKKGLAEAVYFDRQYNLYFLIGSKLAANSSELIATKHMNSLIANAREQLDFVIIDSPPLSCAPDAEILNDMVDANIIVVQQLTALAKDINDGIDALSESSSIPLGCIYNNARRNIIELPTSYGGKYGKYGNYGHYGHYGHYGAYGAYGAYGRYGRKKEFSAYDKATDRNEH